MRCGMRILKLLFPSVIVTTTAAGVHLTFDDGPHPTATPAVLSILRERKIPATFFFLGQNVQQYPDIAKQVVSEGHQIGNHSFTHSNLFFKDKSFIQKQISQTEDILELKLGIRTRLFRPPYGYFNLTLLNLIEEFGSACILWNIDSKDYRLKKRSDIEHRVLNKISNGSILLFHDNNYTAHRLHTYLPGLLDKLLEKKFVFKPLQS